MTLVNESLHLLGKTIVVTGADITASTAATADCVELLNISRDQLHGAISAIRVEAYSDARTWLSATLTNYDTCLDGFNGLSSSSPRLQAHLNSLSELASASLAMLNVLQPKNKKDVEKFIPKVFPSWMTGMDEKLLEDSMGDIPTYVNVTVALDGSGDYEKLQDAVDSAPDKGKLRYVIYVKSGIYYENVILSKKKTNVTIVGDGMNATIISGNRSVMDNFTTFNSATLAAVGANFILQDICIENTAGPAKHQAVALRVGSDRSVINRCQIRAYQDTLYAHSLRQFYRDCLISGTIDFIFGNAAVVLQNCTLISRLPMTNQKNVITAQGRIDPGQNTGTSIQNCRIIPSDDLIPNVSVIPSFLGRPWKNFSRTVYLESYIDSHISPEGWLEWNGDFALDTLYYGEYNNFGPGAGLAGRVNWTGYHVITDPAVASNFTVRELIQGDLWLKSTGVEFVDGL